MAQKLLLNVLVQVLGEFVEGLSEENLKLGVWSGKIVLQNLELNRKSIQKLNLPVTVTYGSVKKVEVVIPWTALESQPVKIDISGICLQVGPVVVSDLDPVHVSERALANKRHKLDAFEKLAFQDDGDEKNATNKSYVQRLTAKILDNLEIRLQNLHIRYEDSQTIPGTVFSAGITVDSFVVATTDENWVETFVARTASSVAAIHKLATMKNFGIYWNSNSPVLANQSFAEWQHSMEEMVYTSARGTHPRNIEYLVALPNNMSVKVIHNEHAPQGVPKLDIIVGSTMINLNVDKTQYHQIMLTKNQFDMAERTQQLFLYRPYGRPNRANAKEWWVYAVKRVMNKESVGGRNMWLYYSRCVRYRARYIDLVVKSKQTVVDPKNPKLSISVISEREADEMLDIEKLLPLQSLTIFRQLAAVEFKRRRALAAIAEPPPKPKSSWFSWGKGSAGKSREEEEEELESLEKLKAELESGFKIDTSTSVQQTWRFALHSSGVMNVTSNGVPVVVANMAMSIGAEAIAGGMKAKFSLEELQLRDLYTPTPLFPFLITVPDVSKGAARLTINFESKDRVSKVRVDAVPQEIAWNKPCIQQILDIVVVPKLVKSAADSNLGSSVTNIITKKKKNEEGEMNFIFEADTPKIRIPDDCSSDCGYMILDAGKLSVRGQMKGDEGMSWHVDMTSINANMPSSLQESMGEINSKAIVASASAESAYLIKPFNLTVDVQTFDISSANMTINVNISPGIRGDLDAIKLARVLEMSQLISSTFSNSKNDHVLEDDGDEASISVPDSTSASGGLDVLSRSVEQPQSMDKFSQYKMIIDVVIPLVSLDMHYDTIHGNHLVLSASELKTVVKSRIHDFQVAFSMNSLAIEDSGRPANFRELAWTHMENEDENLINISYQKINHKRSPLFNGFGSEVRVEFGSLYMNSDTKSLTHLRPFYEVLLGKRFSNSSSAPTEQTSGRSALRREQGHRVLQRPVIPVVAPAPRPHIPQGTHVLCTLGKIRLEFLKPKSRDSRYVDRSSRSGTPDRPQSRAVSAGAPSLSISHAFELESLVALEVSGLLAEVTLMDLIDARVNIHVFEIKDTRASSEDYEFQTIFRPDLNLDGNEKPSSPEKHNAEEDGKSAASTNNLLELKFKQYSKENSVVDISIGSVTSFFSLDIILELISISVANSLAVVALVAPVNKDGSSTSSLNPSQSNRELAVAKPSAQPVSNIMTVCVSAPNMRLILLEDPTVPDTRAVVGKLGIDVKYSRDSLEGELNESLHLTVINAEVFVMMSMTRWNPLQILEPVGLELHYKRMQERGIILRTSIALDIDAVDARVSLNDLILAQSIAARGLSAHSGEAPQPPPETASSTIVSNGSDIESFTQITTYGIHLSLGDVTFVIINDFNGQNLPIIQLRLEGTTFNADGAIQNLSGSGSLILAMDYFNSKVFSWEPILERWFPTLAISTGTDGFLLQISESDESLQLSITSTMLETLLRTYALLLQADDITDRSAAPAVTFQNLLGVPIEVFDGGLKLFDLCDDTVTPISRLQAVERGQGSGSVRTAVQSAHTFDISFLGKMGTERQPIKNLPVHISKPQSYEILSTQKVATPRSNPVVEEVYENERYQPLSGSWKTPFMMNDPSQWSTSSFRTSNIESIKLPPGWDWQGQWSVDISPQPRKGEKSFEPETDSNGWEYAANFSAMVGAYKRHGVPQTFDYVRRRRWIRTRVPIYKNESDDVRPLTMFWDVKLLASGCRHILIRSEFQVKNSLSVPIHIKLLSTVHDADFSFGPIEPDDIFSVPLLYASASSISIQTMASEPYLWSQQLQCGSSAVDYERMFDVFCSSAESHKGTRHMYFRVISQQFEKTRTITVSPLLTLENRMPCLLKYQLVTELVSKNQDRVPEVAEGGNLDAGGSCMLFNVSDIETARISVQVGSLGWSQPIYVAAGRDKRTTVALPSTRGPTGLFLILKVETGRDKSMQVHIFSQAAFLDRSNLDIAVKSVYKDSSELIRRSAISSSGGVTGASVQFVHENPKEEELVTLSQVAFKSSRHYVVTTARHGDLVYVDKSFIWTYLPRHFFGHCYIRTASADRFVRTKEFIEFEVDRRSVVFVLHDTRADVLPKWMINSGYRKIFEQAVARHLVNSVMLEQHYSVYGRIVEPGTKIILGQNGVASWTDMYTVFVLPDIYPELRDQLLFESSVNDTEVATSWADGNNGLSLFSYYNHSVFFGIRGGEYWSPKMHMKRITSGKGPFEIVDTKTNRAYQLCYSVHAMPGKFHRTNLTTVMPRYCIVNCMDEPIEVRQLGTRRTTYVPSYHTEGWHKAEAEKGTQIQIKTNSTIWSFGCIDINEIGSSVLLLPLVDASSEADADGMSPDPVIAHVEIKLAEPHENCAVTVIIWREEIDSATAYSIRNDSSFPVALQQANVNYKGVKPDVISKFELTVSPGRCIPFGWTDPDVSTSVLVGIGKNLLSAGKRAAEISFLETGRPLRISNGSANGEVILRVSAQGSGKVLQIVDDAAAFSDSGEITYSSSKNFVTTVDIKRLGVSLVLDKPYRREVLSLYFKQFVGKLSISPGVTGTEVSVDDIQMDNYSETAVYPVMLYCIKPTKKTSLDEDFSAIKFCMVKIKSNSSTQHYRYIALRVLPLAVEIDSGSLELIFDDLINNLNVVSRDETLAAFSPQKWVSDFNLKLLSPEHKKHLVDVYRSQLSAQGKKMFLENFVLHPMKIQLSFQKTNFPRERETKAADFIAAFASVDRMEIKLSSFIVVNVMESASTLRSRIVAKLGQDLQGQIAQIAGSLSILGSPAGFARNVGNGVQAFFYEPAQGMVQGPQDFVVGIGKGTTSLVSGVLSGALNSTAGVIRNVSSGLSLLSGDKEFIDGRNATRQKATRDGFVSGMKGGGESVLHGFTSGVTGLFTKPYEEAQKDGALGFVRGVGMGVFGAAVKPVIGVTDGITHMAQGISNQLSDNVERRHLRPARAFTRSEADPTELILTPFNAAAAYSQSFVLSKAAKDNFADAFVDVVILDKDTDSRVVLSEKLLYWNVSRNRLWSRHWSSISHCTFIPPQAVGVVVYENSGYETSRIQCSNPATAMQLYGVLAKNAFRMGNPKNMLSIDSVVRGQANGNSQDVKNSDGSVAIEEIRMFNDYQFGTANTLAPIEVFPYTSYEDKQIIRRAEERLRDKFDGSWSSLDRVCWSLVHEWDVGHTGLSAARCCLLLLINKSNGDIQIDRTQLLEGKTVYFLPVSGYAEDSKVLISGGSVIAFGVAAPSTIEFGDVIFSFNTSAVKITVSTKLKKTSCEYIGNNHGGFLEKSVSGWWSKYVFYLG